MPILRSSETAATLASASDISIASPTPRRCFFFPAEHNLSDSPYSTPACSPFEGDQDLLPFLSGRESISVSPPPTSARRTKKGDHGHIKRPENAFILFRRDMCQQINSTKCEGAKPNREADLSKTISLQWRALPDEEKQVWKDLAEEKKREHQREFPDYKYRPNRTKKANAKRGGSKAKDFDWAGLEEDEEEYRPTKSIRGTRRRMTTGESPYSTASDDLPFYRPARPTSTMTVDDYPMYHEVRMPDLHSAQLSSPELLLNYDCYAPENVYDNTNNADDFHTLYPDLFTSLSISEYDTTSASSCRSSPILGMCGNFQDEYGNVDQQLCQAEMDLNAHLQQDYLKWPQDVSLSEANFDMTAAQPFEYEHL